MVPIWATGPRIFFEGAQHVCLHSEETQELQCGASYFINVSEYSEYLKTWTFNYLMICYMTMHFSITIMLSWSSDIQTLGLTLMWGHGQFLGTLGRQFCMFQVLGHSRSSSSLSLWHFCSLQLFTPVHTQISGQSAASFPPQAPMEDLRVWLCSYSYLPVCL